MIGLDTNVLVRFLTQDDPEQSACANSLFADLSEDRQGWVSLVTLAELHWLLTRTYQVARPEVIDILQGLLETQEVLVEQPDVVRRALGRAVSGADFSDALIAEGGFAAGCEHTVTFDRRAAAKAGMSLLS